MYFLGVYVANAVAELAGYPSRLATQVPKAR